MSSVIKVLKIENARLNTISAGRRTPLADFNGEIDIMEEKAIIPVLGRRCKGEKRILASVVLCSEAKYLSQEPLSEANVYEAIGSVTGEHNTEKLLFSGLRFLDNDPMTGAATFEVADLMLIEKMLHM